MTYQATPRMAIPLIAASQAQKHVTHNEGALVTDAHLHMHLETIDAVVPPAIAVDGDMHGLGAAPAGPWVGRAGAVARFLDGGWSFLAPRRGWRATVGPAATLHIHDGAGWTPAAALELATTGRLGVGAAADAANPVSLRAGSMLLDGDPTSGDLRVKLNRAGVSDICSMIWQTGYSGRAELGLSSADTFDLRTSANGATFATALSVSPGNSIVRLPTRPAFKVRRLGADVQLSVANAIVPWNDAVVNVAGGFDIATHRFVAPVAGSYAFSATVFANDAGTRTIVDLFRNGAAPIARGERAAAGAALDHVTLSTVEYLEQGDTVEMRLILGTIRITGQHHTSFCGHLVG